ncbi:DUF1761 family protein [candidate division GN15 bacterium]|nr:DUF1761 family protein [candidate division GN15 bacterium]
MWPLFCLPHERPRPILQAEFFRITQHKESDNMDAYAINYWAVLVAGLAYTILGAIWYSAALFGNAWMQAIGKTKEQIQADFSPLNILWAFIGSLIAAYGIARILGWVGTFTIGWGVIVGLLAAICFVVVSMGVNDLFERRPLKLYLMNVCYHIVAFVIMGIIIGVWR